MTGTDRRDECNSNIVFVGFRKDGVIGYFESATELPDGWALTDEPRLDISDVMESLRADKADALRTMNYHWKR
jgi:hypothetical protein